MNLTINREGEFAVRTSQRTDSQCGRVGQLHYRYFCSITATDKSLTKEGYVMENLWTDQYFQDVYVRDRTPAPSCEEMAMRAVYHFRDLFRTHPDLKQVDLRRIYIRIHGSDVSFIECEWIKKII